ncbi:MAG: dihydrofolate reductase [Steroidobacteraceae bacterium]
MAGRRRPLLSLLVAAADNGVIGRDGGMPWHLPDDLKRFKALTMGKPMLMGRKTFEAIGKPLPGRTNLVLTRSSQWSRPGAVTVHSIEEAIEQAAVAEELVVIGGDEIYRLTLPLAERIYLTRVAARPQGDACFAVLDEREWREVERQSFGADARNEFATTYSVLERVRAGTGGEAA